MVHKQQVFSHRSRCLHALIELLRALSSGAHPRKLLRLLRVIALQTTHALYLFVNELVEQLIVEVLLRLRVVQQRLDVSRLVGTRAFVARSTLAAPTAMELRAVLR